MLGPGAAAPAGRPDDQRLLTWTRGRRRARPTPAFYSRGPSAAPAGRLCISKRGEASGPRIKGGSPSGEGVQKETNCRPKREVDGPEGWGPRGRGLDDGPRTASGSDSSFGGRGHLPATHPSLPGYRWRNCLRRAGRWGGGTTLGQPPAAHGACGAVSSDHQLEVRRIASLTSNGVGRRRLAGGSVCVCVGGR